jgi:hypothetical protein
MSISDEEAAAQAIASFVELSEEQILAKDEVDKLLGAGDEDSFVDINALFKLFNVLYFRSTLLPRVQVYWSDRLTL